MERLGLWIAVLALAVAFPEPARPDPVDTGSGAQRSFLWHGGGGTVKRLPSPEHDWVWRTLPISEPWDRGYTPGEEYDPWLDNAEAPQNPDQTSPPDPVIPEYARWHVPPQPDSPYCPTSGLTGTAAEPIGCYTNRPAVFEIEDRRAFPGLDTIFEVLGADGERGPYPDYFVADPEGTVNDLIGLESPTARDYERALRGLALERDDPAYYTATVKVDTAIIDAFDISGALTQEQAQEVVYGEGGPSGPCEDGICAAIRDAGRLTISGSPALLSRVANPFRGRETPTHIFLQYPDSNETSPRAAGQRYQILDVASGLFDPAAGCDTGSCTYGPDPVDPRLLKYEQILIWADWDHDRILIGGKDPAPDGNPRFFGPYPNKYFSRVVVPGGAFSLSLGGDFSGIVPRFNPYAYRASFGDPLKATDFIKQIGVVDTPGYTPSADETTIAYTNLRVRGGAGELPMRPAPDRSNLVQPDPLVLVAQGLDYPFPAGAAAYERNVDPNTGRPRRAGDTGPCENAAGFRVAEGSQPILHAGNPRLEFIEGDLSARPTGEERPFAVWDDYARRAEAYGILGVGIDEACLKPGGAPEGPNENRFDPAKAQADPSEYPGLYWSDGTGEDSYIYQTLGQWGREGSSEDYALAHHPANQSLFAWICSASLDYFAGLAPGACLLNLFGSPAKLISIESPGLDLPSFSEYFAALVAGEIDKSLQNDNGWRLLIQNTKAGREARGFIPAIPLNRDVRDGRVNATSPIVRTGDTPTDPANLLTIDSTLTSAQKMLLGCGPYAGTRCDSGAEQVVVGGVKVFGEGGGIDLLNAEGGAVTEAMPGTYGTEEVTPRWVPAGEDLEYDESGSPPYPDPRRNSDRELVWVDTWTTWSDDLQPGTIGFPGSPVCTRYAPESPYADAEGIVRLPGCRGAKRVTVNHEPNFPIGPYLFPTIEVVFDEHYSSREDGCLFGQTMTTRDGTTVYLVKAVNEDGTLDEQLNAELDETCFNTSSAQVSKHSTHRWTGAFDPNVVSTWPYVGQTESVLGARTLFHPLAGCESAGLDISGEYPTWLGDRDYGFLCDFRLRNFEADFIEGRAQVFRSEIAAWSWNFLMFLAVTSCNSASGSDDLTDPDCFDPELAWDVTRCSLSTPHLCRNAQILLELTLDENRDGVSDAQYSGVSPETIELDPEIVNGLGAVDITVNPAPGINSIYVANADSNSVSVIDGDTETSVNIPVGQGPSLVVVNTSTNKLYVVNGGDDTVSVIDGSAVENTIPVGASPSSLVVDEVTNRIFVLNSGDGTVSVINGATNLVETTLPGVGHGGHPLNLAINRTARRVYVANTSDGTVSVIDADAPDSERDPIEPGFSSWGELFLAVDETTNRLYILNWLEAWQADATLAVFDAATSPHASIGEISLPGVYGVAALALNERTQYLYLGGESDIAIVNLATREVEPTLPDSDEIQDLAFEEESNLIYAIADDALLVLELVPEDPPFHQIVARSVKYGLRCIAINPGTNRIYGGTGWGGLPVFDGGTNQLTGAVSTGGTAEDLAFDGVNNRLWVAHTSTDGVKIIDTATNAVTDLNLGYPVADVLFNPNTNLLYALSIDVADGFSESIRVIDGASLEEVELDPPLDLDEDFEGWALNLETNRLYVIDGSQVQVIDADLHPVTPFPQVGDDASGIAINEDTNLIYVGEETEGGTPSEIYVIDGETNGVIKQILVGAHADVVAVNQTTNRTYTSNDWDHSISVIDGDRLSLTVVNEVSLDSDPEELLVNENTNRLYVNVEGNNTIAVLDCDTSIDCDAFEPKVIDLPVVSEEGELEFALDSTVNYVYAAHQDGNVVYLIDGDTGRPLFNEIIDTVGVGRSPVSIVVDPTTHRVYVANEGDDTVSVIVDDMDGDGLLDAVETGTGVFVDEGHSGTDPLDPDADDDGLADGAEVALQIDPLDPDTDDDGLGDGAEVALGTDPLDPDTDDDGVCDGGNDVDGTCETGPAGLPDNCPFISNLDQANNDLLPAGDACQCGDVDGVNGVTTLDLTIAREHLVGATLSGSFVAGRCNVIGPSDGGETDCDVADIYVLERVLAGEPVTVENSCRAYTTP